MRKADDGGRPAAEAANGVRGHTVLVVEDDDDVRQGVSELFRSRGYRVIAASNGRDAIAILAGAQPIDLLFSDIVMPHGINGVDVADAAVRLRKDIRVLLTSGYAEAALIAQGVAGRYLIFLKPYHPRDLVETVRGMLAAR